jgi:hypothetical protein
MFRYKWLYYGPSDEILPSSLWVLAISLKILINKRNSRLSEKRFLAGLALMESWDWNVFNLITRFVNQFFSEDKYIILKVMVQIWEILKVRGIFYSCVPSPKCNKLIILNFNRTKVFEFSNGSVINW